MRDQRVLITGGTGSLGERLALSLIKENHVVILSRNEERQFELSKKLSTINPDKFSLVLGSVEDSLAVERALEECSVVIHTAAMKDLVYCEQNPNECIKNNVRASQSLLNAIMKSQSVKRLCGISTDKAVSPNSIYGASKLMMESLFINFSKIKPSIVTTVARFGNMIDSRGSLVTSWKNYPETLRGISHPDCTRFFFRVQDASDFVIDTLANSLNGTINIPIMKKLFIRDVIELINPEALRNVLGLFPGEKISERLVADEELAFARFDRNKIVVNKYYVRGSNEYISQTQISEVDSKTATAFARAELESFIYDY